mgnify:FL=1
MADFLKKNFKSMNMSEEEKKKLLEARKSITGIAAGEKEIGFLIALLKDKVRKELLEEEDK